MLPLADVAAYFAQSNTAGQVIVICLLAFSMAAWTLMAAKQTELRRHRRANARYVQAFSRARHIEELPDEGAPVARLVDAATAAARDQADKHDALLARERVAHAVQRALAEEALAAESKLVFLASIVAGAPFIGLLGTVWGVMDAFGALGRGEGGVGIQVLAPGVAGALLTTVAGLLVAIPSVFGYNYLLAQTKLLLTELENFASLVLDRVEVSRNE